MACSAWIETLEPIRLIPDAVSVGESKPNACTGDRDWLPIKGVLTIRRNNVSTGTRPSWPIEYAPSLQSFAGLVPLELSRTLNRVS